MKTSGGMFPQQLHPYQIRQPEPFSPLQQGFDVNVPHTAAPSPLGKGFFYPFPVWKGHGKPGDNLEDLLGWKLPAEVRFDGVSLRSVLEGNASARDVVFCHFRHSQARGDYERMPEPTPATPASSVRQGNWKLNRFDCDNADQTDRHEFYNLVDDPSGKFDLASAQPVRVNQLATPLDGFLEDTAAVIYKPNPAYKSNARQTKEKHTSSQKPAATSEFPQKP